MAHMTIIAHNGPSRPAIYTRVLGLSGRLLSSYLACRQTMNADSPKRQFATNTAPTTCQKKVCSMPQNTANHTGGQ